MIIGKKDNVFYAYDDNHKQVGHIVASLYENKMVYLSCFGVNKHYRRQGYGRALLREVKKTFTGCQLMLDAAAFREVIPQKDLTNFYQSEGFKFANKFEEQKECIQRMYLQL